MVLYLKFLCMAQVGEFYETQGTDAVVLIQWAGLNPMGRSTPPRAGLPVVNLRRTLEDLVQGAGLSVVRCRTGFILGSYYPRLSPDESCLVACC